MDILKSKRLDHLKYEIRGPVYDKALALQNQGYKITSLNIGNPAAFGFETPDEIVHDIIVNIRNAQGYVDSRGLFAARKAVMQYYQNLGVKNILIEDIYIGNGVSELISLLMTALLNTDDEVLIPSPDYPLWTTVAGLAGGKAVHYSCDEEKELSVLLWPVFVLFHVCTVNDAVFVTRIKCFVVEFLGLFAFDFFTANFVKLAVFFDDKFHFVVSSFVDFGNRTIG